MSRTKMTLINTKVNLTFYILILILTFFSRKYFIDNIGIDVLGLFTTVLSILSFLNLAEMGLANAISFLLFKPIHEGNRTEIKNIISVLSYYYSIIGLIVIIAALALFPFLDSLFYKSNINLGLIYATYFSFLYTTVIGYFFNYKQFLLIAEQKSYVIIAFNNSTLIIKIAMQVICIQMLKEYGIYIYLCLEVAASTIYSISLNKYLSKGYPWLDSSRTTGKNIKKKYKRVLKKARQVFSHQFSYFVLTQTDQLIIYSLLSLGQVTIFANYTLVLQKIIGLVAQLLGSNPAAVGNLIATKDRIKIFSIFREMFVLRHLFAGTVVFCLYYFTPIFIELWLGSVFLLDRSIFVIMIINTYIILIRPVVDAYINGFGIFSDVLAPWIELVLNLSISICLGIQFGLIGVVLGTLISLIVIVIFWKPFYLFKNGLNLPVLYFWKDFFICNIIFVITIFPFINLIGWIQVENINGFIDLLFYGFLIFVLFLVTYGLLLFFIMKPMKDLARRLATIIKS